MPNSEKVKMDSVCKSWKQASWVTDISDPVNGMFRTKNFFPDVKKIVRVGPFLTGKVE